MRPWARFSWAEGSGSVLVDAVPHSATASGDGPYQDEYGHLSVAGGRAGRWGQGNGLVRSAWMMGRREC
jgi:hypothetical protein